MLAEILHQNHHSAVHPSLHPSDKSGLLLCSISPPISPNFPKNHTLASTKMPLITIVLPRRLMQNAPFSSFEGQPCLLDKTFSEQSTTQVYSLSQNAVGKTPSSAPFPPSLIIPPSYFWANSYPVFSKHLSCCTPIWRLNDDNNPHPDPIVTAHQRRRAHPLTLARHTRPERFSV